MNVKDVMTSNPVYISPSTTLRQAAEKMKELDCGFLAIGDESKDKLVGVVTDRDISIRATAEGANPNETKVDEIKTDKVLYCFKDDDVQDAADHMHDQQVYRLIVLNNQEDKRLCGIISLGDIVRHHEINAANNASKGIHADESKAA